MIVYKITNLINGKVYIGQTIQSLEKRFTEHCYKNSKCFKLAKTIKKYGKENFIIEELESCNNIDNLNKAEEYWIKEYNAIENGYNLTNGGENYIVSEETIKNMIIAQNKPEVKLANSKRSKKMHQDPIFKEKHRKATKEAILKLHAKAFNVYIAKCIQIAKPGQSVIYEKGGLVGTYHNQSICAKELNTYPSNIQAVLSGKRKMHKGYIFEYKE